MKPEIDKNDEPTTRNSTENDIERNEFKTIVYPFGKYQITVNLDNLNRFIGITEIKINKEFISSMHQIVLKDYHDVLNFYEDP